MMGRRRVAYPSPATRLRPDRFSQEALDGRRERQNQTDPVTDLG